MRVCVSLWVLRTYNGSSGFFSHWFHILLFCWFFVINLLWIHYVLCMLFLLIRFWYSIWSVAIFRLNFFAVSRSVFFFISFIHWNCIYYSCLFHLFEWSFVNVVHLLCKQWCACQIMRFIEWPHSHTHNASIRVNDSSNVIRISSAFTKVELVNYSMMFGVWFLFDIGVERKLNSIFRYFLFETSQYNCRLFSVNSLTIIFVTIPFFTKAVLIYECFAYLNKSFDFSGHIG